MKKRHRKSKEQNIFQTTRYKIKKRTVKGEKTNKIRKGKREKSTDIEINKEIKNEVKNT